ncbi:MAG: TetR/AcrR family transcriptional regulator [Deltaproteobacteria bacterium]|nr:TetR/AcrR family transcriptional regulator [Deltaproteobacteria bacterium]
MPKRTPSPALQSRGTPSIQRILDAAASLFGTEGYRGASMTAVAEAAGVSKGLLHYHFRGKEHLLFEAQRATYRRIHEHFQARFNQGERGIDTALEALDALWQAVHEMRTWAPFMMETMSLASQNERVLQLAQNFLDESTALLESGVTQVFKDEQARLIATPRRVARVVRACIQGLVVELSLARTEEDLRNVQEIYEDMRNMFEHSVLSSTGQSATPRAVDSMELAARTLEENAS